MAYNHFFLLFAATFAAFVLLILVTLSAPLIQSIYFVDVVLTSGGKTKFGVLGYCGRLCSSVGFGYHFGTQITSATSTTLVLFPTAAGVCILLMLALFPLFCGPRTQVPQLVLSALSLAACASSIAAFIVGAYLSAAAISGFKPTGEQTGLGPAIWMSLVAAALTTLVAVNLALGPCFGGRLKRSLSYTL